MSTENHRPGAAARPNRAHANQTGGANRVPRPAGERPVSTCLKKPGPAPAPEKAKIQFEKIERVETPAPKNARDYKNLRSRFRRFRNRLIIGNPADAASGLIKLFRGKIDFIYIDLYSPERRRGFPRGKLPALLPLLRELLAECGSICLRCNRGARRETHRAVDAVFGSDRHIATDERGSRAGDCFVIYGKTDVYICNRHIEPLETDDYNKLSARLEHIIKTWSSDDSLVAGFFHDVDESVTAAENAGRRWMIVASSQTRSKQAARKRLLAAQATHHASGRAFRPFDIYAMI